jgi:sensor histidine kinase YesM
LREDLALSELNLDRQALRAQRSRLYGTVIALTLLLMATLLFFVMRRNILQRKAENLQLQLIAAQQRTELESQLRSVQQQALQTRMNPHFTFNCLNSIQACILRQDQDAATLYLAQFARLVRQAFEFAELEWITVEQELAFLSLYCDLENLRFGNRVAVSFEINPSLDPELAMVPPLILQPLVENAFQHAFPASIAKPQLHLSVRQTSTHQIWTLRDNGIGPQVPEPTKFGIERTPSGIAKTRERLALLRTADEQPKAEMDISPILSAEGQVVGTCVEVKLWIG